MLMFQQDLKDFGREAGSVSFADIDRDYPGDGYACFLHLYYPLIDVSRKDSGISNP
jgi:hypothetical protein